MSKSLVIVTLVLVAGGMLGADDTPAPVNLLRNGQFSDVDAQEIPAGWTVYADGQSISIDKQEHPDQEKLVSSLRIDVKKAGDNLGAVSQKIKHLPPHVKLVLTAWVKISGKPEAKLQVKLKQNKKETNRVDSDYATAEWRQIRVEFETGEADELSVQLRFSQSDQAVGSTIWIAEMNLHKAE